MLLSTCSLSPYTICPRLITPQCHLGHDHPLCLGSVLHYTDLRCVHSPLLTLYLGLLTTPRIAFYMSLRPILVSLRLPFLAVRRPCPNKFLFLFRF